MGASKCKPRYFYHVTTKDWGQEVLLRPKRSGLDTFNRDYNEPRTARICVAPTVEQCFVAIPYRAGRTYRVYRSKQRISAHYPRGVCDSKITGERWIRRPVRFVHVDTIEGGVTERFPQFVCIHQNQRETLRVIREELRKRKGEVTHD